MIVKFLFLQIWLTKDEKLIILHGGDSGEMPAPVDKQPGYKPQHIFNMTFDEIQTQFKKTKYWINSE